MRGDNWKQGVGYTKCPVHGVGRIVKDENCDDGERLECPMCEREGAKNRVWYARRRR